MTNTEGTASVGGIEPIEIQEEMERSFLEYSMSVIVSRALPDVRDGLKPVHRRILWGMHTSGFRNDRPHVKCARVSGDVMANYHPHGNSAIYDALVRMAQPFSLRHPLIDFHGNYGSPDHPPAAERYTECRLGPLAQRMLDSIDEETVDFEPNYDGTKEQPVVLPSRFPNLLVNGSQGIAVGMATNIPPHNLGEVIDATVHFIDNPDATSDDLMAFVKGPDFPTGGLILGRSGIQDAYRTGRGSIRIRALAEIQETKRGTQIVVTEIPYQTSLNAVAAKIKELVDGRELDGIREITNLSAGLATKLVIELKREANANVVLNNLYKQTPLQGTFSVNTVALVDGIPRTLDLAGLIRFYVEHQIEVITRRSQYRLRRARERAHILEGLIRAIDQLDAIIAHIRGSDDRSAARQGLMVAPFSFSETQATHILDMTLGRLTRLGRAELEGELVELQETIAGLVAILEDPVLLRQVIKDELASVRAGFATPRLSEITIDTGDLGAVDLIEDEELVVTITRAGYVKAVGAATFRTQARGGRGIQGTRLKEEDIVSQILHVTAHDFLLFFSNKGRVYRLRAFEIPIRDRNARGTPIVNLLPLAPDEKVQAIISTKDFEGDRFLTFITKLGQVKRTVLSEYDKSRREGFIALGLRDDDELVRVIATGGNEDIFVLSMRGMTIRFSEQDVRPMGRSAAGVRGMRLKEGDEVVAADQARDDVDILLVTDAGYGKRTKLERFTCQVRGGQGVRGIRLTARRGYVVAAFMVAIDDDVLLISSSGVTIKMAVRQIPSQGRDATGVRVMNLDGNATVASAAPILLVADINE